MTAITVTLNAKLQPMHRHDIEDALESGFEQFDFSVEITGGGTSQNQETGEVEDCDIELEVSDTSEESIQLLIGLIEAVLAPVGSQLTIYSDDSDDVVKIPFGKHEGLALYLNGTDLPENIYTECDVNFVYEECERLLGDFSNGNIASHWSGPTETALYLYGKNFDDILSRIKPLLDDYPLCQKCRVVKIA